MSRFRHTGIRSTQLNISRDSAFLTSNDGLLISAPMAHQNIVIMDVLVMSGSGKLGTAADGGGTHLCNVNQGYNHVRAPISVPNGQAVYTDIQGGAVTVTYAIGPNFSDTSGAGSGSSVGGTTTSTTAAPTTTSTTTTTAAPNTTTISWAALTSSITEAVNAQIHYVTVNRDSSTGTATAYYETSDGTATAPVDYIAATGTVTFNAGETSKTIAIEIGNAGAANESDELFTITLSNPTWTNGAAQVSASPTHTVTVVNYTTTTAPPTTTTTSATQECGVGYSCVCSVYACNMPYDWMNGEWVWSMTGIASHPIYRREDPNDSNQFGLLNWNTNNFGIFHGWNIYYDIWDPGTSGYIGKTDLYRNTQGGDCPYDSLVDNGWTWDGNDLSQASINETNITCPTTTTTTAAPETYFAWSTVVSQTLAETAGHSLTLTVQRTGDLSASASVMYATSDITATENFDYFGVSGTLTFNSGVSSRTITIYPKEDNTLNGSETFKVTLSSPTHVGGPASIVWPADEGGNCTGGNSCANMPTAAENIVTMIERHDATVAFSALTSSMTEGNAGTTTHIVTVTRDSTPTSGVVNEGTVTVDYVTSDGTATTVNDYGGISGTLTFAPGVTSQDIGVDIAGDTNFENDETFNITLQNPSIDITGVNAVIVTGYDVHVVTITNDDTTTSTTSGALSNACVGELAGSEYYWTLNGTFEPVVGANATYYSKTQYVNVASHIDGSVALYITYNGTESKWKIHDQPNLGGSMWAESNDDGVGPWDATWTDVTVVEKANATHCYPTGTTNLCIDASGYDEHGEWVPYNTYNGKPVWWNQGSSDPGSYDLFMWFDVSSWEITDGHFGSDAVSLGVAGGNYSISGGDATNPWDADWSAGISGCSASPSCVTEGDCPEAPTTTTTTAAPALFCVTNTGLTYPQLGSVEGDWYSYTLSPTCNSRTQYHNGGRGGLDYYMSWNSAGGTGEWVIEDGPCGTGTSLATSNIGETYSDPWSISWSTSGLNVDQGACVGSNVCILQSTYGYPFGDDFNPIPDWVLNTTWTPNGTTCHWMNAIEYTNNAPDGTTLYLSNSDAYDSWGISTTSCDDFFNNSVTSSDGSGDNSNPWGETWSTAGFTVTELHNGRHCYPEGTANFCIDASGYPSIDTTWVPYHTLTNQSTYPVWWNQYANGAALFMWHQHDISTQGWIITSDQWGDNTQNYWASSDDDAANPWSADWTSELDSIGASISSGDCS